MPSEPIDDEAKQVIFNVYLYFTNEAEKFKNMEDGYFLRVQERVAEACCVSRRFVQNLLRDKGIMEQSTPTSKPTPISYRKRKMEAIKDKSRENSAAKVIREQEVPTEQVTSQNTPPPLAPLTKAELKPFIQSSPLDVPPLTPIETKPTLLLHNNCDVENIAIKHENVSESVELISG